MSQARRKHGAGTRRGTCPRAGGGGGLAVCHPSSPFLPCVRTPGGPPVGACTARAPYGHGRVVRPAPSRRCLPTLPLCPRGGGGGRFPPPPLPSSPTLRRAEVCGGGGGGRPCRLPFVARISQARCKHGAGTRRGTCPSAGGRALAVWLPSSPFLPCVRTPGGPPVGACMACAPYGHGRVVRPAPSLRCLPTLPLCPLGGGGGRFPPPPSFIPHPWGGGGVWGGGGAPLSSSLRSTHVAGTTQARRKHEVRHLAVAGGGGGFLLWAFLPFSMVEAPHPRISSRCCPLAVVATSTQGAQCPVPAPSCAHTYWRRYVPGWKRVKRKCGQRGGLTVRLEGFLHHPPPWSTGGPLFRHPTARGGASAHPLPGALLSTSERHTGAVVSVRWKWRLQSGLALSSPGSLPPPSAMEAPEVLWRRRGETRGGFICGIPWPSS